MECSFHCVMENIRVVIVDDHQQVREAWKMLLHNHGAIRVVKECSSGSEAIQTVPSLDADVVLMDINMSPVNGFEATKKILKLTPHVKIIGVSINNNPSYARNIIQLGARGYVTKNCSKEEMVSAIHDVIKGKTFICKDVLDKMRQWGTDND
jgi:two-component system, NarL family, invasion response regulator UvrY